MKVELVYPTADLVKRLSETMSPPDRAEVEAIGETAFSALAVSIEGSRDPKCWMVDGEPMAMFGVACARALTTTGSPWLLTSHAMPRYSKVFLRGSKSVVEGWREEFSLLRNFVDIRHRRAIRWLQWLGFTVDKSREVPIGPYKAPFYAFEMRS